MLGLQILSSYDFMAKIDLADFLATPPLAFSFVTRKVFS
jgi:hypothetical protein